MRLRLVLGLVLMTGFVTTGCAQDNLPAPVQAAVNDLATHLNIPAAQITVVHLEGVTWPDASLGCPQPGMAYAQVLVEGYKVILEALGHRYEYHTDMTGRAVRAWGDQVTAPPAAAAPDVVGAAIADLSARLGVPAGDIEVVSWKEQMWMDGSLGLPEPGMVYTKAIVSGFFVVLGANERQYAYHCSENAALPAGLHIPEGATPTLLCLMRTEPQDGNNFFRLVRMDPAVGGQTEEVFPHLSDFAATPDGKGLAAIVRTSRSGHDLVLVKPEGTPAQVDRAFSFGGLAWSPLGHRLAYLKRASLLENRYTLEVYDAISGNRQRIHPGIEGDWSPGGMAWTLDGLAFTAHVEGQAPRVLFWDGAQTREMVRGCEVLSWIPRTSSVLVRQVLGADAVALGSLRLRGDGEVTELLRAGHVLSASDVPGNLSALCVIEDQEGALKLVQATWGGMVKELMAVPGKDAASVMVSPVGWIATLSYVGPEDTVVEVLRLGEELMPLMKLPDCALAVPVVR